MGYHHRTAGQTYVGWEKTKRGASENTTEIRTSDLESEGYQHQNAGDVFPKHSRHDLINQSQATQHLIIFCHVL